MTKIGPSFDKFSLGKASSVIIKIKRDEICYLLAECSIRGPGARVVMSPLLVDDAHQFHPSIVLPPGSPHPTLPHRHVAPKASPQTPVQE